MKIICSSLLLAVAITGYAAPRTADYVVHEWGTFTSLQGADGVQLAWRPEIGADLPKFVYRDNGPKNVGGGYLLAATFSKGLRKARQRMETPVLYFYSSKPLEVDVEVRFPQGTITEWFPRASHAGPAMSPRSFELPGLKPSDRFVRWDQVMIRPDLSPNQIKLKRENGKSHYYPAREAMANPVQITTGAGDDKRTEMETLLFYRGIGDFEAPLEVTVDSDESRLRLRNTGLKPISRLVFLEVCGDRARFQTIDGVRKSAEMNWTRGKDLRPLNEVTKELGAELVGMLMSEGLYAAEAKAMVNTWRDSWFEENGVRVLYPLARAWTDGILPLGLSPRPRELVRVMIGRAELIPPSTRRNLARAIELYHHEATRGEAVKLARSQALGRFLRPAVQSALPDQASKELRQNAEHLVAGVNTPRTLAKLFGFRN